jgi:hypothetical protein
MIKMNERLYARMIKMLFDGCTAQNICAETGLHIVTAQSYLRALHDVGAVHISGWVKNKRGADATKIYTLGVGEDKPRFKLTRTEIARRYKFKQKLRKKMEREQSILNQEIQHEKSFTDSGVRTVNRTTGQINSTARKTNSRMETRS